MGLRCAWPRGNCPDLNEMSLSGNAGKVPPHGGPRAMSRGFYRKVAKSLSSSTAEDGEIEVRISKISPLPTCVSHLSWLQKKLYSTNEVSKNLRLISLDDNVTLDKNLPLQVHIQNSEGRPLVVLLAWLMAREKHLMKYASFYLEQGFDVLMVNTTPWQFLWPVKGSQVSWRLSLLQGPMCRDDSFHTETECMVEVDVCHTKGSSWVIVTEGELLEFLHLNKCYQKMLLHGFSVGGYMWGETLLKIIPEPERYTHVVDRIVGQIWDSAVDISEIPVGVPRAIFQRNLVLQATAEKYIRYHMRTFHNAATQHYIRSSQMFYTNLVRAPALFLLSKTDPIGTEENNKRVWESWESLGVKTRNQYPGHGSCPLVNSPMTPLVLTDSSEKLPEQIMYPYAEPYDLQKHISLKINVNFGYRFLFRFDSLIVLPRSNKDLSLREPLTYVKCWDKSPHVGHFRKHPKEYVTELATFLDRLGLVAYPEKIEAKLRV
uniref:Uncharacterized protein n=1 Tax=Timema cristinae TaxID=61476 RepID=A0A7R9GZP7_TIMCR|nr:unnamed protein product [Timema cristinae]